MESAESSLKGFSGSFFPLALASLQASACSFF